MDLHCHLDLYRGPKKIVDEIARRNLVVFSVTTTPSAFRKTRLLSAHVPTIHTGIGLHPQIVADRFRELDQISKHIMEADFVGEIGLDGGPEYRGNWLQQIEVFTRSITEAERIGGKVLSIHSRRAANDVLKVLAEHAKESTPILHWFSGTLRELEDADQLGCWFSVGPAMLSGNKGRLLLKSMPKDRVLLETDGPFTQQGGQPYMPWDAERICPEIIAEVWREPLSSVKSRLAENLELLLKRMSANYPSKNPCHQC